MERLAGSRRAGLSRAQRARGPAAGLRERPAAAAHLSTLTFWLAEAKVDKGAIGLFALVGLPYTWKFLWSPIIDRVPLPLCSPRCSVAGAAGCCSSSACLPRPIVGARCVATRQQDLGSDGGCSRCWSLSCRPARTSSSTPTASSCSRSGSRAPVRPPSSSAIASPCCWRVPGALVIAEFAGWFWAYAAMAACLVRRHGRRSCWHPSPASAGALAPAARQAGRMAEGGRWSSRSPTSSAATAWARPC